MLTATPLKGVLKENKTKAKIIRQQRKMKKKKKTKKQQMVRMKPTVDVMCSNFYTMTSSFISTVRVYITNYITSMTTFLVSLAERFAREMHMHLVE